MNRGPRRVEDFNEIFAAMKDSDEPILLVGGHAVNVWALNYYDRAADEIRPYEPLTSSDMDLYATRSALLGLSSRLGARLWESAPREIVLGAIEVRLGSTVVLVEAFALSTPKLSAFARVEFPRRFDSLMASTLLRIFGVCGPWRRRSKNGV